MVEDQGLHRDGRGDARWGSVHHLFDINTTEHLIHRRLLEAGGGRVVEEPADEGEPEATDELAKHEGFEQTASDEEIGKELADTSGKTGGTPHAARNPPHDGAQDPSSIE